VAAEIAYIEQSGVRLYVQRDLSEAPVAAE
jgi:hypothetical protein